MGNSIKGVGREKQFKVKTRGQERRGTKFSIHLCLYDYEGQLVHFK